MAIFKYSRFKIRTQSRKSQGLQAGDVVRRQYEDDNGRVYSLMVVMETGSDTITDAEGNLRESAFFIGALIEGDEPRNGELLDFVRVASLFDADRSGALYLTASDSDSPYMDVIDGLGTDRSLLLTDGVLHSESAFRFPLNGTVSHPERLLVSFKIRASKPLGNVPLTIGYKDETDGADNIDISTQWEYKLSLITIDYPSQYKRELSIASALDNGEWCEITELNVVRLSDIAAFSRATKVRMGRITGIIDPVFGVLDGYGAYFQNLYATRNVNIAGTLTAGDENGFASTFYVGRIHKNVVRNSIDGEFTVGAEVLTDEKSPTGIGNVWRLSGTSEMKVQSGEWRTAHAGRWYCFSLWVKSAEEKQVVLHIDSVESVRFTAPANEWRRFSFSFIVASGASASDFGITIEADGVMVSSPQLEAGKTPSQYQPTDGTLSCVEDYGAWFSKGGIGGTIQNPLLKLNEDGSISSRDDSFVIYPDGTGHFASGRFRWTKDTIALQDVTIRWEDMAQDAQDELSSKSVGLTGTAVFHYPDIFTDEGPEPDRINIFATENGFSADTRKWYYLDRNSKWSEIPNGSGDFLTILPDGHYWEGRSVLTIRYAAAYKGKEYESSFTVFKQFDGSDAYSVYIISSNGLVFRNNVVSTTLSARVMKGGEDVTGLIPEENFRWYRTGGDPAEDRMWNDSPQIGRSVEISGDDVFRKAVFDCEVILSATTQ